MPECASPGANGSTAARDGYPARRDAGYGRGAAGTDDGTTAPARHDATDKHGPVVADVRTAGDDGTTGADDDDARKPCDDVPGTGHDDERVGDDESTGTAWDGHDRGAEDDDDTKYDAAGTPEKRINGFKTR